MPSSSTDLGVCPLCGEPLTEHDVVIEYETADGLGVWAACPACGEIVTPDD